MKPGVTPAELYFARDLYLPVDLLRGNPPVKNIENSKKDFVQKLKEKLDMVHHNVRQRLDFSY